MYPYGRPYVFLVPLLHATYMQEYLLRATLHRDTVKTHQQTCKFPRQRSASLGHLGGCGNSGRPFARLCTGRATRALHSNRRGLIPKICKDGRVIGKIRDGRRVLGGCANAGYIFYYVEYSRTFDAIVLIILHDLGLTM